MGVPPFPFSRKGISMKYSNEATPVLNEGPLHEEQPLLTNGGNKISHFHWHKNCIIKLQKSTERRNNMARTKKPRCPAKTKAGKRCKNSASGKSKFCGSHKKR